MLHEAPAYRPLPLQGPEDQVDPVPYLTGAPGSNLGHLLQSDLAVSPKHAQGLPPTLAESGLSSRGSFIRETLSWCLCSLNESVPYSLRHFITQSPVGDVALLEEV